MFLVTLSLGQEAPAQAVWSQEFFTRALITSSCLSERVFFLPRGLSRHFHPKHQILKKGCLQSAGQALGLAPSMFYIIVDRRSFGCGSFEPSEDWLEDFLFISIHFSNHFLTNTLSCHAECRCPSPPARLSRYMCLNQMLVSTGSQPTLFCKFNCFRNLL